MKMYCVYNRESKGFLNYASKKKKLLSKGYRHYVVESPFPTLRPKEHIKKHFNKWIMDTPDADNYIVVEFVSVSDEVTE